METRRLGAHGPEISVVGYGGWEAGGEQWGAPSDEHDALSAMHAGVDAGINWIDTAEAYGEGRSEELVGKLVRERGHDRVMVFTKVAHWLSGCHRDGVRVGIRASLGRLGLDHVDLYQVHWPDPSGTPIEETWGAMAELQDEGLTRYIGVSNFDRGLIERCLGIRHVDSVQNQFSLLHRHDAADLLPWLAERGIGYLGYGSLAFGLLSGTITARTRFDDDDWRSGVRWRMGYYEDLFAPGRLETSLGTVERLRPVAERLGVPLATLALRAAIDEPGVTAVIAGSRRPGHVRTNAAAGDLRLDRETLQQTRAAVASRGRRSLD